MTYHMEYCQQCQEGGLARAMSLFSLMGCNLFDVHFECGSNDSDLPVVSELRKDTLTAEGKKDWTIISLFAQRDKESNGEEVVPDLETDVEEEIIHTITLQKLREVLMALPKEDAALLTALYLQTPPLTSRAYSEQTGIPVMTLHYRKEKLLQLLKKLL